MATLTRRRPTALERTRMTPEQELELLVDEQAADDTYSVDRPQNVISLDAPAPDGEGRIGGLIGRDPWGLVDAAIDLGLDPAGVAYAGELVDVRPRRRGLLGSGIVDPSKIPHGTAGGYQNHRCRCIPCTVSWAGYKRERRAARKARS